MKLEEFLAKTYNYNANVKNEIKTYVEQWLSWYKGNVKKFHNYYIYNGNQRKYLKRFSMNMAKEISEDWSDILWSEKCKISLKDENAQKGFDDFINDLDLYYIINQAIEKSGALGTCACVVSAYDIKQDDDTLVLDTKDAKLRIDIVDVDNIYPLSWTSKEITECAFGSVEYVNGKKYVVLSVHKLQDNGNYIIKNHLFEDTQGSLTEITGKRNDVFSEYDTKGDVKWFSIFRPMLTNNLFENSPFGISHYANAIDNLKSVDLAFDTIQHEINNGKRRIFVRADMFNYDDGQQKFVFDNNDTSIYQLPTGANKDDLIQSESEEFRTNTLIEALNTALNMLGSKVGFGENHYHFDGTNLSTATAVVSSNSKLFRRKKKLEIGYESSIFDLVNAIAYVSTNLLKNKIDTQDMVIQFDDSIIEDKEAESNRAMREQSAGLISKVEYRMKIFGETEEIAKQKLQEIQEEEPSVDDIMKNREDQDEEPKKEPKEKVEVKEDKEAEDEK